MLIKSQLLYGILFSENKQDKKFPITYEPYFWNYSERFIQTKSSVVVIYSKKSAIFMGYKILKIIGKYQYYNVFLASCHWAPNYDTTLLVVVKFSLYRQNILILNAFVNIVLFFCVKAGEFPVLT